MRQKQPTLKLETTETAAARPRRRYRDQSQCCDWWTGMDRAVPARWMDTAAPKRRSPEGRENEPRGNIEAGQGPRSIENGQLVPLIAFPATVTEADAERNVFNLYLENRAAVPIRENLAKDRARFR